jgi:nucleotide-binding universal stress UspA family protein
MTRAIPGIPSGNKAACHGVSPAPTVRLPQGCGTLDQAGAYPSPGQPERRHGRPADGRNRLEHPVVVGFDGSPSSRNALAYAGGVARRLGRSLLVVHVSAPGMCCEPLTGQVMGLPEHTSELERWLLTELDHSTDRSGLDVHVLTRRGRPARELAAAAAEQDADALIIGAPSRARHRMGGSVPGWLARHARCPVIVVP